MKLRRRRRAIKTSQTRSSRTSSRVCRPSRCSGAAAFPAPGPPRCPRSDAFVDRHLDLANRHREEVPRLCFLPRSAAVSTVYAWSPELGKDVFTPLMAVPHNSRNGKLYAVTRTCRGVLLLRTTEARMYYLCNPSMAQIAALPDGRMAGRPYPSSDYASFGLGYDARSRSHKVVRLLYCTTTTNPPAATSTTSARAPSGTGDRRRARWCSRRDVSG